MRVSFVAWGFYTMMALLNTSSWSLRLKIWTTHIPECDLIADGPRLGSRSPSLSATLGRRRLAPRARRSPYLDRIFSVDTLKH